MTPKKLTTAENAQVKTAWKQYLDESPSPQDMIGVPTLREQRQMRSRLEAAWEKYQAFLDKLGVYSTIFGYRIKGAKR